MTDDVKATKVVLTYPPEHDGELHLAAKKIDKTGKSEVLCVSVDFAMRDGESMAQALRRLGRELACQPMYLMALKDDGVKANASEDRGVETAPRMTLRERAEIAHSNDKNHTQFGTRDYVANPVKSVEEYEKILRGD